MIETAVQILLVEDDKNLGFIICDNLEQAGYKVHHVMDGDEATKAIDQREFHLYILDIMLPMKDGFTIAEEIRKSDKQAPILFLTARSLKEDRIKGFLSGGDDYITKPFSIEELLLRIDVFLRRSQPVEAVEDKRSEFRLGNYHFDYKNLKLSCENFEKSLTQREADILRLFSIDKNKVVRRNEILVKIWGDDDYFYGRSLDVFISKLRKYLSKDPDIKISNFHGIGFCLKIPE
jgi:DNA-binding response OmpR family regulator